MNFVLIDLENVQPTSLALLHGHDFRVLVFVGSSQTKMPLDFVEQMQKLGDGSRYVRISGTGRNALDFHIAFFLGHLSQLNPKSSFHIVSKDRGFDPLIEHMASMGIKSSRVAEIAEIAMLGGKKSKPVKGKTEAIVENLRTQGSGRPRKVRTLRNTINAWFGKTLSETELDGLIKELKNQGSIVVEGDKVTYDL